MGTLPTLGLNGSFYLGTNALAAQRAAVEVTAHNIANANTPGYARQRVNLQTNTPIQTAIGQQGTGVDVHGIEQLRNAYMDDQIPPVLSKIGYFDEKESLLNQVQTNLAEPLDRTSSIAASFPTGTGTGLNSAIEEFFNSWSQLGSDPTNDVMRRQVIVAAQNVAGKLNDVATRLLETQTQVQNNITTNIGEINDMLSNIADLNSSIAQVENGNIGTANDLRDKRQQVIEELSKRIQIDHQVESNGMVTIRLGNAGGDLLVDGVFSGNTIFAQTVKLTTTGAPPSMTLKSWTGGETESAANADTLGANLSFGTLTAQLEVANDIIGDSTTGLIQDYDRIAAALAELVNPLHAAGFTLEAGFATAGNSTFFDDNGVSGDALGTVRAINIQLNSAVAVDPDLIAASATAGQPLDGTNAVNISNLRTSTAGSNLGSITIQNYYLNSVSTLGSKITEVDSQVTTQKLLNDQLQKQRDSVMGVDMDEETTNLLIFQHGFEVASMLINTVNEMMRAIIQIPR